MSGAARLFVGVYPRASAAERMLALLAGLELPEHRATALEQVHLTVQFIGEVPASELDAVRESVRRSCAGIGAFALSARRVISLPERGPARLVAVETDAPAELLELKRRLARRLSRSSRRDGAERFTPHLTLCRLRRPTRLAPRVEADASGVGAFVVEEVRLMRSVLRREGAEHGVVEGVGLGAG